MSAVPQEVLLMMIDQTKHHQTIAEIRAHAYRLLQVGDTAEGYALLAEASEADAQFHAACVAGYRRGLAA